jgi:hypothetical protein
MIPVTSPGIEDRPHSVILGHPEEVPGIATHEADSRASSLATGRTYDEWRDDRELLRSLEQQAKELEALR